MTDPGSVALFSLLLSASTPSRAAIYRATLGDLYPNPCDGGRGEAERCDRLNGLVADLMNRGLRTGSEKEALYLAALDSLEDLEDALYPI